MKAEQLWQSILQEAIQGKLVPQLSEEPSVEQQGAVLEEMPFAIPDKWKWITIGELTNQAKQGLPTTAFRYIDVASIKSKNSYKKLQPKEAPSRARKIVNEGMVIYSMVRPYLTNTLVIDAAFAGEKLVASTAFAAFSCNGSLVNTYIWYILQSPYFLSYVKKVQKGISYPAITEKQFYSAVIPIPPVGEQHRIVAKLNKLKPLVDSYGQEQEQLEKLESDFPEQLKKSILQEAIQGKLVPQRDDEPEVEQIGEAPEEVPFAIPEKWKWVHLKDVSSRVHYGYTASTQKTGKAKLLRITDIQNNRVTWQNVPYCSPSEIDMKKYQLNVGDIVIARTGGTIGKNYLIKEIPQENSLFASYLLRVIPNAEKILPEFLSLFLESPYYWIQLKAKSRGTGQPNVNATSLSTLHIPLPPIDEQKRIIQKVKKLSTQISNIYK